MLFGDSLLKYKNYLSLSLNLFKLFNIIFQLNQESTPEGKHLFFLMGLKPL